MRLREAIAARDLDAIDSALERGEKPVFGTLTAAATTGDAEIVRRMLDAGATPDASTLCKAAECGHVEVIFLLVRRGTAPDTPFSREATTPLMYAAARGHLATMEALVSLGASIRRTDAAGRSALDAARRFGQQDAVAWLEDRLAALAPPPDPDA